MKVVLDKSVFGRKCFGRNHFWPKRLLARPLLARFWTPETALRGYHIWPAEGLTTFGPPPPPSKNNTDISLDGIPALDLWDLIVLVFGNTIQNMVERGNPLWSVTKITDQTSDLKGRSTCWTTLIVFRQMSSLRIKKLCCMCLRTTKQWSTWSSKEEAPQWDMFPQFTELLLTGDSIGRHSNQRQFHTWRMKSLLCLFHCGHFSSTVCSEALAKRAQQDSGEERVTAKSRPMMRLVARAPSNLSSSASESPPKKNGNSSPRVRKLRKRIERGNLLWQRPKNRVWPLSRTIWWKLFLSTLLKVGLQQSLVFSIVESWQIDGMERGKPLWILGDLPKRNKAAAICHWKWRNRIWNLSGIRSLESGEWLSAVKVKTIFGMLQKTKKTHHDFNLSAKLVWNRWGPWFMKVYVFNWWWKVDNLQRMNVSFQILCLGKIFEIPIERWNKDWMVQIISGMQKLWQWWWTRTRCHNMKKLKICWTSFVDQKKCWRMWFKCESHFPTCTEILSKTLVISWSWFWKEVVFYQWRQSTIEWAKMAEKMMLEFAESGHPIFRATIPQVSSKAKDMANCQHCCFDVGTIETIIFDDSTSGSRWNRTVLHDERHCRILTIPCSGLSWMHSVKGRRSVTIKRMDPKQHKIWTRTGSCNLLPARQMWSWDCVYGQFSLFGQNFSWIKPWAGSSARRTCVEIGPKSWWKDKTETQWRKPAGSSTRTTPIGKRIWTDVEPGEHSLSDHGVPRKLIHLLQHAWTQWKDDGAVVFCRIKDDLQKHFPHCPHWSDDRWKESIKKRFQCCAFSSGAILYLRVFQGRSGRSLIDPTLQDNVVIPSGLLKDNIICPNIFSQNIHHVGYATKKKISIRDWHREDKIWTTHLWIPWTKIVGILTRSIWKHSIMHNIDINLALKKGLKFYQTPKTFAACCFPKVVSMEIGEGTHKKVCMSRRLPPTISLKHDWGRCSTTRKTSCATIQKSPIEPTNSKPKSWWNGETRCWKR